MRVQVHWQECTRLWLDSCCFPLVGSGRNLKSFLLPLFPLRLCHIKLPESKDLSYGPNWWQYCECLGKPRELESWDTDHSRQVPSCRAHGQTSNGHPSTPGTQGSCISCMSSFIIDGKYFNRLKHYREQGANPQNDKGFPLKFGSTSKHINNVTLEFSQISILCSISLFVALTSFIGRIGLLNTSITVVIFNVGSNLSFYLSSNISCAVHKLTYFSSKMTFRVSGFGASFWLVSVIFYNFLAKM